ncbi:uncharacterized protein LOC126657731 [Mercurialis annua]|uniref:uncharacterized protein LOC126657731 n=1 Tax=Mercurialis annua TaxID=3986 RepID=UPI00216001E7|nr:uncharacterized protein LOC126657731 [Mercurialis annua]
MSSSSRRSGNGGFSATSCGTKQVPDFNYEGPKRFCSCNMIAPRWVARSGKNFGRMFYSCFIKYQSKRNPRDMNDYIGCNYFEWHDESSPPQLIDSMTETQRKIAELKLENERLRCIYCDRRLHSQFNEMQLENFLLKEQAKGAKSEKWKYIVIAALIVNLFVVFIGVIVK